jgi:hypothetical protein
MRLAAAVAAARIASRAEEVLPGVMALDGADRGAADGVTDVVPAAAALPLSPGGTALRAIAAPASSEAGGGIRL